MNVNVGKDDVGLLLTENVKKEENRYNLESASVNLFPGEWNNHSTTIAVSFELGTGLQHQLSLRAAHSNKIFQNLCLGCCECW